MRALVQRVLSAAVDVVDGAGDGTVERVGEIGQGLCVFVGVTHDDDDRVATRLADAVWQLRLFDDDNGVINVSAASRVEAGLPAELLVVSQFTLYGDTNTGRRPSWIAAARPEVAEPLVEVFVSRLRDSGATVATGRFRTEMRVSLVNDGPVTVTVERSAAPPR